MKRSLIFLFALFYGTLFATEENLRQIRSLSDRGLFDAAEALGNEKLGQPDLTESDQISFAAELVRSYSQQLLRVEPAQRTRLIRQIESLESTWLAKPAASADPDLALARITFRLQLAMAYQSLGHYLRLEADLAPETKKQEVFQQARIPLQDALERLKKGQQEIQAFRLRTGNNADSPLKQKILALEYSLMMQQGIVQKSLALTFATEAERNLELRRAADTLSELAAKNSTEPLLVQCKLEKAACHRLCGELDRCADILMPLLNILTSLSPECRLKTETEWIRYHIAAGKNIAGMRQHYAADRAEGELFPDFDLARLELFLMNDPTQNIRPEITAATKLQGRLRQFGPYWERRVGILVGAQSSGTIEWNSAEMLSTLAENHFREQRFVESAELYEQAATKADTNRQVENIFRYNRLAVTAWGKALEQASAESKKEYQNRLISLLRKLSVQNPNHPEASALHLAAIDLQRQQILLQPTSQDDYLILLREHLEIWTQSPLLPRLRRELVVQWERQGDLGEAAALLPLLEPEQFATLTPAMQLLRARQLDTENKTEEAVHLLNTLLKQKKEPATLQLLAEILTRQSDKKSLEDALNFWEQLARSAPKNTETWWTAREGMIDVFFKLNRHKDAQESFQMLPILYPELGGAERKERFMKRFERN